MATFRRIGRSTSGGFPPLTSPRATRSSCRWRGAAPPHRRSARAPLQVGNHPAGNSARTELRAHAQLLRPGGVGPAVRALRQLPAAGPRLPRSRPRGSRARRNAPMTERLYYTEPNASEFDAQVLGVDLHEGRRAAVLDRTAFYPASA